MSESSVVSEMRYAARVDVLFASSKLQKTCSTRGLLMKRFGDVGAKKIELRLQQLRAVATLEDMRHLPGRCHELSGDLAGMLAIDVHHPHRLILRPAAEPPPLKADGGLDWASVEAVVITDVIDYH